MNEKKWVQPATISMKDYVSEFIEVFDSTAGNSITIVKGTFTQDGLLRFSKVYKGGENKGENAELQLAKELKNFYGKTKTIKGHCEIKIIANKSPSIISAEQFSQFYRSIKTKSNASINFSIHFAHPCSYVNQRALNNLNRVGIKLKVLSVEDILLEAIKDIYNNIETLNNLQGFQSLRGCRILVDDTMLQSSFFLCACSIRIGEMSLHERKEKGIYVHDVYVNKLRNDLRKLLGLRGRLQRRTTTTADGRKSSSLDRMDNRKFVKSKSIGDQPLTVPYLLNESFIRQHRQMTKSKNTELIQYLLDTKENKQSILYHGFQDYKNEFLLFDQSKALRTHAIEGSWKISCIDKQQNLVKMVKGFASRVDGNGISSEDMARNISNLLTVQGHAGIEVNVEIDLVSLPDKTSTISQAMQFRQQLEENFNQDIKMHIRYAGLESFSVPDKTRLRKLHNTAHVSVVPLHVQDIILIMVGEIQTSLCCLHWSGWERGCTISVDFETLNQAMHLLRSAIKITNDGKVVYRIGDGNLHELIHDHQFIEMREKYEEIVEGKK